MVLVALAAAAVIALAAAASCAESPGRPPQGPGGGSSGESDLDRARSVEQSIDATKGGWMVVPIADGSRALLTFPPAALDKDATFVVTPFKQASDDAEAALAPGVVIEEKGKEGRPVKLAFPVLLSFAVKGEMPADEAAVVRYAEDGKSYEVVPSVVKAGKGQTTIVGSLLGFSRFAPRKVTPKQRQDADDKRAKDFTWHILVNDNVTTEKGGVPFQFFLKMDLKNRQPGKVAGTYEGTGYIGEIATSEGVTYNNKMQARFSIFVIEHIEPVPLEVAGSPASKKPPPPREASRWEGHGRATFTGGGSVSGRGGAIGAREEPWTIDVWVDGASVKLNLAEVEPQFRGTIRGQGNP